FRPCCLFHQPAEKGGEVVEPGGLGRASRHFVVLETLQPGFEPPVPPDDQGPNETLTGTPLFHLCCPSTPTPPTVTVLSHRHRHCHPCLFSAGGSRDWRDGIFS